MDTQTRTALELVVRDRDHCQLRADNPALLYALREIARAEAQTYNMVLATFAGALGYSERRRLELALATGTDLENAPAQAAGPDDDEDDDEPALRELDRNGYTLDPQAAIVDSYVQAELDTQAAPMGGWEPRS